MIGHVYERVVRNELLLTTAVATCDREISEYICALGGMAVMTSNVHERASDRCAEALEHLEKQNGVKYDIVVMVQGDEPMIHPAMISEAVQPMISDRAIKVVNLMGRIKTNSEFEDNNCIKVVVDLDGNALYFSRQPVPWRSKHAKVAMFKQVCVIPFRRDFLLEYARLAPTPLEIAESVDMMRVLEHGIRVRMVLTEHDSHAVDTPDDLARVERLMSNQ